MGYIVSLHTEAFTPQISDAYIKRTSRFGAFHGSIVLTKNIREARVWTREGDAEQAANTLHFRFETYEDDRTKYWEYAKAEIKVQEEK